ncbi:MAG: ergothioneine biosynthesis protein EgtB [Burkholderiales bacterium]|nr:ergothioneine biosynthesis protein EgtB [Burkholderiales bacterium]
MLQTKHQGMLARHYNKDQLAAAMRDARSNLLAQVDDLSDAEWRVPYNPNYNPVAWEIGHVAWFAEWWTLRGPHTMEGDGQVQAALPARHAGPDHIFNSSIIPHSDRWQVSLPPRRALYDMLATQLDATLGRLAHSGDSDEELYFYRLALFHEDMHVEALIYLRDHLSFSAPSGMLIPRVPIEAAQVLIPAGLARIGQEPTENGFYFDNEKWAHTAEIPALQMDATPLSCGAFLSFVEAGGYATPDFWPEAAGHWRSSVERSHPERWRKAAGGWQCRWFDQWLPLPADMPVLHVNAYEAEAYCRWAKRSLPSEVLWETAARQNSIQWGGGVWEWMSNAFTPYAGFSPDPYRDYSAPWFESHHSLRGGSFATHARMRHAQYRNFYLPERSDIFAGFRSCLI